MFHRNWCKQAVFLSETRTVKLVQSDTLRLIKQTGTFEPDDVLTAPTGVAAFNVNGMTLHSAFLLGHDKVRSKPSLTKLIILVKDCMCTGLKLVTLLMLKTQSLVKESTLI